MTIDSGTITSVAAIISALTVIGGVVFALFKWVLKQNKQDTDIKTIKDEQAVLTTGILACLKGLHEQGCDGPVDEAIKQLEDHINKQAHK